MSAVVELRSTTPEQTVRIGSTLGALLRGGEWITLGGPLGAGKTQFVKGLALGIGIPADEPIVSPTFVLVREYVGRLRLQHADMYRLAGPAELEQLGLDELGGPDAIVAIEWAERVAAGLPAADVEVAIEHRDSAASNSVPGQERMLHIRFRATALAAAFRAATGEHRPPGSLG